MSRHHQPPPAPDPEAEKPWKTIVRQVAAWMSVAAAGGSLWYACSLHHHFDELVKQHQAVDKSHAYILVGCWTLIPPLYFFAEWVWWTNPSEEEHVKHLHELARNFWIAFVIVLAVMTGIKWSGAGE
jgi:hypothetical protein